jgi:hypothetical protein
MYFFIDFSTARWQGATMNLLQSVLESAIEYTRIRERAEEGHIRSAHEAVEKAQQLEEHLASSINEARHDTTYADAVVESYRVTKASEDTKERRNLAVSELSHHIKNYMYAEQQLHEAHVAELKAREEEDKARQSLNMLAEKEEELRATLKELKVLNAQKKKERKEFYILQ